VASSTTEDASTCSDRSSQGNQPVKGGGKSMEVSVTVISLDGVVAKNYQPKSKLPTKKKKAQKVVNTTASVVASFSHYLPNQQVNFFTHVPSLPIEMTESSRPQLQMRNKSFPLCISEGSFNVLRLLTTTIHLPIPRIDLYRKCVQSTFPYPVKAS